MARMALGVAGAIVGAYFGAPQLGFAIGYGLGSLIDPEKGPHQEGPRVTDLKVQNSSYGSPIPVVWGSYRLAGSVIFSTDIIESSTTEDVGGKGGPTSSSTTYTYAGNFAVAVCRGPITRIRRIWGDSKLIFDSHDGTTLEASRTITTVNGDLAIYEWTAGSGKSKYKNYMTFHYGTEDQLPDATMEAKLGAGNVPAHRGLCYITFKNFPLQDFGNRLPSISVEVEQAPSGTSAAEAGLIVVDAVPEAYVDQILGDNSSPMVGSGPYWMAPDFANRRWVFPGFIDQAGDYLNSLRFFTLPMDGADPGISVINPHDTLGGALNWGTMPGTDQTAPEDFQVDPYSGDYWYQWGADRLYDALAVARASDSYQFRYFPYNFDDSLGQGVIRLCGFTPNFAVALVWEEFGSTVYLFDKLNLGRPPGGFDDPYLRPAARHVLPYEHIYDIGWCWVSEHVCYIMCDGRSNGNPLVEYPPSIFRLLKLDLTGVTVPTLSWGVLPTITGHITDVTPWTAGTSIEENFFQTYPYDAEFMMIYDAVNGLLNISATAVLMQSNTDGYDPPLSYPAEVFTTRRYGRPMGVYNLATSAWTDLGVQAGLIDAGGLKVDDIGDAAMAVLEVQAADWHKPNSGYAYDDYSAYVWTIETRQPVTAGTITWNFSTVLVQRRVSDWSVINTLLMASDFGGAYNDVLVGAFQVQGDRAPNQSLNAPAQRSYAVDPETQTLVGKYYGPGYTPIDSHIYDHRVYDGNAGIVKVTLPVVATVASNATLDLIVRDISQACGLSASDFDVTALATQTVRGFCLTREVTGRGAIESLQQVFLFDGVESDGVVKWHFRAAASSVGTLTEDMLAAREYQENEEGGDPLLITNNRQELDLPESLTLTYQDQGRDYQAGAQIARRFRAVVHSRDNASIEVPVVLTADEAKGVVQKALYLAWATSTGYEFNVPLDAIQYDPGDVVSVNHRGNVYAVYLTEVSLGANNVIGCRGFADDAQAFLVTADTVGTTGAGFTAPVLTALAISTPVLIDGPLLSADTDTPGFYAAVSTDSGQFPGAVLYSSTDGAVYGAEAAVVVRAKVGTASTALASGQTTRFDAAHTVEVSLTDTTWTLESVAKTDVLRGLNRAMLGNEMIGFTTATSTGTAGHYTLSGLLRGMQGTDWAVAGHAAGDRFVLLEANGQIVNVSEDLTQRNTARSFKAVTSGGLIDDASATSFTAVYRRLMPLSPVHITATRDGSNNVTLTWVRRARLNAQWYDNADVALDETTESYSIDILNGVTVVRTLTSASPTVDYLAADATSDGLTPGDPVSLRVYQISSRVGRGFPGSATV